MSTWTHLLTECMLGIAAGSFRRIRLPEGSATWVDCAASTKQTGFETSRGSEGDASAEGVWNPRGGGQEGGQRVGEARFVEKVQHNEISFVLPSLSRPVSADPLPASAEQTRTAFEWGEVEGEACPISRSGTARGEVHSLPCKPERSHGGGIGGAAQTRPRISRRPGASGPAKLMHQPPLNKAPQQGPGTEQNTVQTPHQTQDRPVRPAYP